jgi:Bacterial Ig-like domain (group 3)
MRYGGKVAAASAAMACGALLAGAGPASAVPASASQPWGAAIQVPGLALLPHYGGSVQTRAVSCASPGNCSAVGNYDDGSGDENAFTAAEVNGTWQDARELPVPPADNAVNVHVNALSCPSAGNCGAGGFYNDTSGDRQAFVANEVHGTWQDVVEVLSTEFLSDENAEVLSISCPSAGNCAIGGDYMDGSGHRQAYVGSERNGAWEASLEVPGTPALNRGGNAQLASVSCASAGNCAAGGYYYGGGGNREAFVVSEKNATWGNAREVAGALNSNGFAEVGSVSCPTAGNCGAGGLYDAKTHGGLTEGFVVSDKNGTWGSAQEVAGKLNGGGDGSVTSVSCRSAGYCTAGGYYLTGFTGGKYESFVVSQTKGSWGSAGEVPGTGALNAGGEAGSVEVSCASAGNCAVTGDYEDKSHHTQAFISGSAGGRWAVAEAIPGSVALNKGGDAAPLSVSCASAASCAVGGGYDATPSFALGFVASGALPQTSRSALTLSAGSVTFGHEQSERVTVTVSPQRSGKPSGTVTVRTGSTVLCAFALNSAGKGSCPLSAKRLAAGKHSLAANYGGSVGYSGSGSAARVVTVVR